MKQLTGVDQALRQASDAGQVPGAVAMATTENEIIYQGAFGKRDLGKADAMTADTVFWIASMTKAITAAAHVEFRILLEFERDRRQRSVLAAGMHGDQPLALRLAYFEAGVGHAERREHVIA